MEIWIARTKLRKANGDTLLGLYSSEPNYSERYDVWLTTKGLPLYIDEKEFPTVTFENSPQKVELKLI